TAFALVHALALLVAAGQWTLPSVESRGSNSHRGHGAGFAQRSQARRSAWPNRVYVVSCSTCHAITDGVVHLRQLSTSCRHGAVAFGYRRVNVPPDGDLHPAVCTPSQAHERGSVSRRCMSPAFRCAPVLENRCGSQTSQTRTPRISRPPRDGSH